MLHRRISRSPGATVFHAGGADRGQTSAPDCRVPAANGSDRILWTRRSNEGWPASCPLDDPSFATAVSTCSPVRKGPPLPHPSSLQPEWGKGSHSAPVLSGRGFPGRGPSRLLQSEARANGEPDGQFWSIDAKRKTVRSAHRFPDVVERDNGAYAPLSLRNRQTGMPICFALSARLS